MKIEKVRVFMVAMGKDEHGADKEGVVSVAIQNNVMPLIAMDDRQYKHFSGMAQEMANESGRDIWVAEFTSRQDIQKFERQLVQPVGADGPGATIVPGLQYAKAVGMLDKVGGNSGSGSSEPVK